jgi:hypothetical protein
VEEVEVEVEEEEEEPEEEESIGEGEFYGFCGTIPQYSTVQYQGTSKSRKRN